MSQHTNLIIAIANSVTALAIIVIIFQTYYLYKQLKSDHERSRRENAVKFLLDWSLNLEQASTLARKFVEELDEENCRKIVKQSPTTVPLDKKNILLGCLVGITDKLEEIDNSIKLSEKEVSHIRWLLITYLNKLESILTAYRHGIVDKEMIKEQFKYLVSPENGHYALEKFRKAAGGKNTFPSIYFFVEELKREEKQPPSAKPPIA